MKNKLQEESGDEQPNNNHGEYQKRHQTSITNKSASNWNSNSNDDDHNEDDYNAGDEASVKNTVTAGAESQKDDQRINKSDPKEKIQQLEQNLHQDQQEEEQEQQQQPQQQNKKHKLNSPQSSSVGNVLNASTSSAARLQQQQQRLQQEEEELCREQQQQLQQQQKAHHQSYFASTPAFSSSAAPFLHDDGNGDADTNKNGGGGVVSNRNQDNYYHNNSVLGSAIRIINQPANPANGSIGSVSSNGNHPNPSTMLQLATFKPAIGCTDASDFLVRCFVARLRSGITVVKHGRSRWCKSRLRLLHLYPDGYSLSWKPGEQEPPSPKKRLTKLDLRTCIEVRHAWSPDPKNPMYTGTSVLRSKCEAVNAHKSMALIFPRRTVDITACTPDQCKVLMEGFSALCYRLQLVSTTKKQQQETSCGKKFKGKGSKKRFSTNGQNGALVVVSGGGDGVSTTASATLTNTSNHNNNNYVAG